MTLAPFRGLLTCLRPRFLPSGCCRRRFCCPGSLCTLATLLSSNSVSVSGDNTEDHPLVGVSPNHSYETVTSKIPLSLKEGWERIPEMGVFKGWRGKMRACRPKRPKLRFWFPSLMPWLLFSKTASITPLVWKPLNGLRCHILISIFFPRRGGKVVTNKHKQLYHMDGNTFFTISI